MKISIQKKYSFYLTFPINGKKGFGLFFNCNDGCNFSSNKGCVWENSQKCKHTFFSKKKE